MRYIHQSRQYYQDLARAMMTRYETDPEDFAWVWECSFEQFHAFLYVGFDRSDQHEADPLWRSLYDLCEKAEEKWVRAQPWPKFASYESVTSHRPFKDRLGVVEHISESQQEAYVHWTSGGGNFWPKKTILWNQPSKELLEANGISTDNL